MVSLLPSATEILCALTDESGGGLLVGRSHECDYPAAITRLPALTAARTHAETGGARGAAIDAQVRAAVAANQSLYSLNEDALIALKPDAILTQDLCAVCSIDLAAVRRAAAKAERLHGTPVRVHSSNPDTLEGVLDDVLAVGSVINRERAAAALVASLRERFYSLSDYANPFADGPRVVMLDWADPIYVAGHWTAQMIERAGGQHPLNASQPINTPGTHPGAAAGPIGTTLRRAGKSVRVTPEIVAAVRPEFVFIAPCGLPLNAAVEHARALTDQPWFQDTPAARAGQVHIIDGNQHFNRPGPRLADAFAFLVSVLNDRPEVMPAAFPFVRVARR